VLAAALGPFGAAVAGAPAATVVDDFSQGANAGTVVTGGSVQLKPLFDETFDGIALPTGWSSTPTNGGSAVSGGALTANGALVDSGAPAGPGNVLAFRATFATAEAYQHVGFGTTFAAAPWAMFSTKDGTGLYARTYLDDTAGGKADTPIPDVMAGPHDFRIAWTATGFDYYVDGNLVHSDPIPIAAQQMRPLVSDYTNDATSVSVESMKLTTAPASGTYTSSVLDGGAGFVSGITLNATATTPDGTTLGYETRTGSTSTPDASWSGWAPLGAGGAVAAPARYLQYRANLSTSSASATPAIGRVAADFAVDDQGPVASVTDVTVSGTSATVRFTSDDAAATYACRLDGGAFAVCTSPATFSGLAPGTHTFAVQGTDAHANVGAVASRQFVIAAPAQPSGSGSTDSPASSAGVGAAGGSIAPLKDVTAPKVVITPKSVRLSSTGRVTLKVKCPKDEARCAVTLRLRLAGQTVAKTTATIGRGKTVAVSLKLPAAVRAALVRRTSMKVTASATATDAAGNAKVTTAAITLKPATAHG
jgi:hypothetical protein